MFTSGPLHFCFVFLALFTVVLSSTVPSITAIKTITIIHARDTKVISFEPITLPHATISNAPITLTLPSECVQTEVPDSNGYVTPGSCGSNYNYYPSLGAAVSASILFGIVTVVHIAQAAIYKKSFCWVLIMGAIWETGSYVVRSFGSRNQQSNGLALVSQLLVLLSPLWVNAFVYTVLGHMIYFYLPSHSLLGLSASTLAFIFVSLDIISFIVQLVGGGMADHTAPLEQKLRGTRIYMGGIGMQEVFIIIFLGLAVKFHMVLLRMELNGQLRTSGKENWRKLLYTIYASLLCITIRIIFRLIEFSAGSTADTNNPLILHEFYFYVFDAIPMFLAILVFAVTHPGMSLKGPDSIIPKAAWMLRWAEKRRQKKNAKKQGTWEGLGSGSDSELVGLGRK